MRLSEISDHLRRDENDVWRGFRANPVHYPQDGNEGCYLLEDNSFWFQHRNDCISSAVEKFPPEGAILDVGGGNGFVTRRLLNDGFEAALLEPGPVGAIHARKDRHIPVVICETFPDAHIKNNSLAGIGLFDVLEHIEDDMTFASLMCNALKPGGIIYITVPAHRWLWSRSDITAQHFRRYSCSQLATVLTDRFHILLSSYIFQSLVLPLAILRVIPFRLGLSRNRELLSSDTEHGSSGGIATKALQFFLRRELARIRRGKTVSFGASCLLVGRKAK